MCMYVCRLKATHIKTLCAARIVARIWALVIAQMWGPTRVSPTWRMTVEVRTQLIMHPLTCSPTHAGAWAQRERARARARTHACTRHSLQNTQIRVKKNKRQTRVFFGG